MRKERPEQAEQGMTTKAKVARLNAAFDAMAAGLTEDELAQMTAAMTEARTIKVLPAQRAAIRALARKNGVSEISL